MMLKPLSMFPYELFAGVISGFSLWLVLWVIISIGNRQFPIIIKRGIPNIAVFTCSTIGVFLSFILVTPPFEMGRKIYPCSMFIYLNYNLTLLFFYGYMIRAIGMIFEKHINMISALSGGSIQNAKDYLEKLSFVEKLAIRHKGLLRKLEKGDDKAQIIFDHLNDQHFYKPKTMLKNMMMFLCFGTCLGTIVLLANASKFSEPDCPISSYYPLYILIALLMLISIRISISLRKFSDPYFLKWEFVIVMGFVIPISFLIFLALRFQIHPYSNVPLLFAACTGHFVSIVIPNILVLKQRNSAKYEISDNMISISSIYSIAEIKKKAAERFCIELAVFKEDYDAMKALRFHEEIEQACSKFWDKFFARDAPMQLNLPDRMYRDVRVQLNDKNYIVLDTVYQEVRVMLYQNLQIEV